MRRIIVSVAVAVIGAGIAFAAPAAPAEAADAAGPCRPIAALARTAATVNVVVMGDSTGNERHEWVYLTAQRLAKKYPKYTVRYSEWGMVSEAYLPSRLIQTGTTTGATLRIWNASAPGQSSRYHLYRMKVRTVLPATLDLLLVSHGHNEDKNYNDPAVPYSPDPVRWRQQYENLTTAVTAARPGAAVCSVLQNPKVLYPTIQAQRNAVYEQIAADRGYGAVDVHTVFTGHVGWQTEWMADSTHPNAAGQVAWGARVGRAIVDGQG